MNSFKGVRAFQIELEFGIVGFEERGKPDNLVKNLLEQAREPTTNSTHIWLRCRDLTPHHIGGRRVLSPLHHPCSPHCCFTLLMLVKCSALYPTLHFDEYSPVC